MRRQWAAVDFVEVLLIPSSGVSCLTAKESEENAIKAKARQRERERNVVRDVRLQQESGLCV